MTDLKEVSLEQFKEKVLFQRILEWNTDRLVLENGLVVTLKCTDWDCCADAYGSFKPLTETPPLDAVITDIVLGEQSDYSDDGMVTVELKIYHNQNIICEAEMTADCGGSGYYYSVGSLAVDDVFTPIVKS